MVLFRFKLYWVIDTSFVFKTKNVANCGWNLCARDDILSYFAGEWLVLQSDL